MRQKIRGIGLFAGTVGFITLLLFSMPGNSMPAPAATAGQKKAAFLILNTKCNICHRKQNKKKVFTPDNMSDFAGLINLQVFVKRRMPKGSKIKLTAQEYQTMKEWLLTQNLNINK